MGRPTCTLIVQYVRYNETEQETHLGEAKATNIISVSLTLESFKMHLKMALLTSMPSCSRTIMTFDQI